MSTGGETSLKGIFQGLASAGAVTVLQGIVKSASPLKIQIVNDEKLIIGQNITIVPRHLTDHTVTVAISGSTGAASGGSGEASFASHSHGMGGTRTMTIYNALKAGDMVHVLAFNAGKQYFVLDKVG